MSWFKNTAGDPIAMSNSNFDKRPVREPLNDPRLAEFDLKSPPPPARAEAKAAVEIKAPVEPKATPADPKSSAESKAAAEAKPAADAKPAVEAKQPSSVFGATLRAHRRFDPPHAESDDRHRWCRQGRLACPQHHRRRHRRRRPLCLGSDQHPADRQGPGKPHGTACLDCRRCELQRQGRHGHGGARRAHDRGPATECLGRVDAAR